MHNIDYEHDPNWKEIPGTDGKYFISNFGIVRSRTTRGEFELFPCMCPRGFLVVSLYVNGYRQYKYVHRLVAEAFCSREPGDRFVFHKDGNKCNNDYTNLYWCATKQLSYW